jgi:hypothetical protein
LEKKDAMQSRRSRPPALNGGGIASIVVIALTVVGIVVIGAVVALVYRPAAPVQQQQQPAPHPKASSSSPHKPTGAAHATKPAKPTTKPAPLSSTVTSAAVGPLVNGKLVLGRVYMFYASDIVTSGTGSSATWNFYNRTRRSGSPDASNLDRHTLRVVVLAPSAQVTPATAYAPNLTLPATLVGADVAPFFYSTAARINAATLRPCGVLATNASVAVLCGSLLLPEREGEFRLGWLPPPVAKRHAPEPFQIANPLEMILDVTCDDDVFCNGPEYFVRGVCTPSAGNPCIFGSDPCLQHNCSEAERICAPRPNAAVCPPCGPLCTPKCVKGQKCGSGGCPACTGNETLPSNCVPDTYCGTCTGAGEECIEGQCIVVQVSTTPGSCNNPYPLFANVTDRTRVFWAGGNPLPPVGSVVAPTGGTLFRIEVPYVDNMEDHTTTVCGAPGVQEHVYEFEIALPFGSTGQGVEVMMIGLATVNPAAVSTEERFPPSTIDSLLAIHGENCQPLPPGAAAYSVCSDDATPPGDLSSHLYTRLTSGRYRLIATFFGTQTGGPYVLMVKFNDADSTCFPQCDGKYCGIDECQMNVGGIVESTVCGLEQYWQLPLCNAGTECVQGRCSNCTAAYVSSPAYISSCPPSGSCGFDQCNLLCNKKEAVTGEPACTKGSKACSYEQNKCISVQKCDNAAPECQGIKNGVSDARFCGSDCNLYRVTSPLPDLVPESQAAMVPSIVFNVRTFNNLTCGIPEGCLGTVTAEMLAQGLFDIPLMRFDTNVINLAASFHPPAVDDSPHLYTYSKCHGHNHFGGFAHFDLKYLRNVSTVYDLDNIIPGGKLAYCMEDSSPYYRNPLTPCLGVGWCGDQGIQYGWFDRYPGDLDCQWLVLQDMYNITANQGGWFVYRVCTNFARAFTERTFNNNCRAFPVYIPPLSVVQNSVAPIRYVQYVAANPALCNLLPAELPLDVEWPVVCPR